MKTPASIFLFYKINPKGKKVLLHFRQSLSGINQKCGIHRVFINQRKRTILKSSRMVQVFFEKSKGLRDAKLKKDNFFIYLIILFQVDS